MKEGGKRRHHRRSRHSRQDHEYNSMHQYSIDHNLGRCLIWAPEKQCRIHHFRSRAKKTPSIKKTYISLWGNHSTRNARGATKAKTAASRPPGTTLSNTTTYNSSRKKKR